MQYKRCNHAPFADRTVNKEEDSKISTLYLLHFLPQQEMAWASRPHRGGRRWEKEETVRVWEEGRVKGCVVKGHCWLAQC